MAEPVDVAALHNTYKQIAETIGVENMLKLYHQFGGLQIQFPMRLYDRKLVAEKILREFDGHNVRELSNKYGYSQRWIYKQLQTKQQS